MSQEKLRLLREALEAKQKCWRKISETERLVPGIELSEDKMEDFLVGTDSLESVSDDTLKANFPELF